MEFDFFESFELCGQFQNDVMSVSVGYSARDFVCRFTFVLAWCNSFRVTIVFITNFLDSTNS